MFLISVEVDNPDNVLGFIEDSVCYQAFEAKKGEKVFLDPNSRFLKKDYKPGKGFTNYEWVAAVIGKFNPYTMFWKEKIPLKELTFNAIKDAIKKHKSKGFTI